MIQMGSAFCSLINGGNYYKPHVVKQLRSSNGEVVSNIEPTLVKQTISKETSDKLRKYMKETVDSGTGTKAKMKDYTAGGKTGTDTEEFQEVQELISYLFVDFLQWRIHRC